MQRVRQPCVSLILAANSRMTLPRRATNTTSSPAAAAASAIAAPRPTDAPATSPHRPYLAVRSGDPARSSIAGASRSRIEGASDRSWALIAPTNECRLSAWQHPGAAGARRVEVVVWRAMMTS
jgi:hypothetical protein